MKLVSIIVPTFNRINTLPRALESIFIQDYKNYEIIIVDNNSTDGTEKYIKLLNNEKIKFFQINNKGIIAKSRNFAIEKSSGDYIAFLDSDDWWLKDKLSLSIELLENGYDFVYHDMYLKKDTFDVNVRIMKFIRFVNNPVKLDLLKNGNAFATSSIVLRKNLLNKVGFFMEDEKLNPYEDFFYWIKIAQYTNRFRKLNQVLGVYCWDGNNTTNANKIIRSLKRFLELNNYYYKGTIPFWINKKLSKSYFLNGNFFKSFYHLGSFFLKNLKNILLIK